MYNMQEMANQIRKIKSEAAQKSKEAAKKHKKANKKYKAAKRLDKESEKLTQESVGLQENLIDRICWGKGTLGDSVTDLAVVASKNIDDTSFSEVFINLRDEWYAHQDEYFVIHRRQTNTPESICKRIFYLGLIEDQIKFEEGCIFFPAPKGMSECSMCVESDSLEFEISDIPDFMINASYLSKCECKDGVVELSHDLYDDSPRLYGKKEPYMLDFKHLYIGNERIAREFGSPWADYSDIIKELKQRFEANLQKS